MNLTIDDRIRQAKASLAIEGMHMSKQDEELIRLALSGKITRKQFLHEAKKLSELGM